MYPLIIKCYIAIMSSLSRFLVSQLDFACHLTSLGAGIVSRSAWALDVWERDVFSTVNCHQMLYLLKVHGTCRYHCTYSGNSGIARVIADTTVCSAQRKKERFLELPLSSIMGNGPLNVSSAYRFISKFLVNAFFLIVKRT